MLSRSSALLVSSADKPEYTADGPTRPFAVGPPRAALPVAKMLLVARDAALKRAGRVADACEPRPTSPSGEAAPSL